MPKGVGADDCSFFGLHTILFDFSGVVVDFGASIFVSTPFSWVVWEQPSEFLPFSLGCSFSALTSFYFLYFSWQGYPPVEVVFQPSLCLVDLART